MLVLHRAKLLASNQSVLALGVAPMRVVSRWCRCIVQRLCATDCKRPCLVRAAAPYSAPARMPGVYAQRLYARTHTSGRTKSVQDAPTTNDHDCTDAKPTKHTQPFTGERGAVRHGCRNKDTPSFKHGCLQVVEQSRCRTHRQQTTTVAQRQSHQSVLKGIGIINQKFIS